MTLCAPIMEVNMSKRKTINNVNLPKVSIPEPSASQKLPYNGQVIADSGRFSFSFVCFDRTEKLFNLGSNEPDKTVSGKWFIDLMDCLKSISGMTVNEAVRSPIHDLHRIDWKKTNMKQPPKGYEQQEYYQFRINKSKGRVIGILIDSVFYVVWLDPHHNLTNSVGYGGANIYKPALSLYEEREKQIAEQAAEIEELKAKLNKTNKLLEELLYGNTEGKHIKILNGEIQRHKDVI